jgi:hypothetical protein
MFRDDIKIYLQCRIAEVIWQFVPHSCSCNAESAVASFLLVLLVLLATGRKVDLRIIGTRQWLTARYGRMAKTWLSRYVTAVSLYWVRCFTGSRWSDDRSRVAWLTFCCSGATWVTMGSAHVAVLKLIRRAKQDSVAVIKFSADYSTGLRASERQCHFLWHCVVCMCCRPQI